MSESALLLTEEQWDDAAVIAHSYLDSTSWVDGPSGRALEGDEYVGQIRRRRALAKKIADAGAL